MNKITKNQLKRPLYRELSLQGHFYFFAIMAYEVPHVNELTKISTNICQKCALWYVYRQV